MDTFEGYVERVTFRNEENGYTVLSLETGEGELTCIGTFPSVSEGEYLEVQGEMTVHPLYGEQLKVISCEFRAPSDERAIEKYLASGAVKGIGEKMAKRIVETFGKDTVRIMEEEPERLAEIKGISQRMAMDFAVQVIEKRETRSAVLFLSQYGISLRNAAVIYKTYGNSLYSIVRENPYRLADDISGIGFKTADEIAGQMGFKKDSEFRIRAGLIYTLQLAAQNGHTCLPRELLLSQAESLLGITMEDPDHLLLDLAAEKKLVLKRFAEGERIYLRSYFNREAETARMLMDMNIHDDSVSVSETNEKIRRLEKEAGLELDELQRLAVTEAARNGITIITGGPGTGKTTTINMMIRYFLQEGLDIMLAAPTGRAAKRMTEATGYEAQTIHRLLEVNGDPSENAVRFQKNQDSPLEADVIIIDEMSMVDISLMNALLKALVPGMRLI
ncbi:MAG: AAA family ATPase, partial [Lachnospiraceae bacterium]|nr:AAA family ATPase [Lachnospiraceae bacterium]